jgi:ubiquinone/menaquinone biosynthesis C-methylase UbiE/uncharacterized protein YbaR (Trm112 family)
MLKSLASKLVCPACKNLLEPLVPHVFNEGVDDHIRDGILLCSGCRAWYPIEDELLELVPAPLLDRAGVAAFVEKFADQFLARGVQPSDAGGSQAAGGQFDGQLKQREHFDLYAEGQAPGFKDYTKSPFIRAASQRAYKLWAQRLERRGAWMLDVGCGTANSSFPFVEDHTVIGFDISKKVIRSDIEEARTRGCSARTTFFVGDGAFPPFKDGSFDYVHTVGALHHLPNPADTIKHIQRILVPGGLHFAAENNHSVFRGIFDLLMKIYPLWIEEAGAEPLMTRQMIDDWCRRLPVKISSQTSIFVPPHLINLLSQNAANRAVEWTDRFFSHIPFWRVQGGILLVTIAKVPA